MFALVVLPADGHRLTSVNIAHLAQAQFLYRTQLKVTAADLPTWLFSPERIIQCLAAGQTPVSSSTAGKVGAGQHYVFTMAVCLMYSLMLGGCRMHPTARIMNRALGCILQPSAATMLLPGA